jgi:hypothetical protein
VRQGQSDAPYKDEARNLVVCPLLYDGSFVQLFYEAWNIAQTFLAADAQLPPEAALPSPASRQVARTLVDRREYPVLDVVAGLTALAQPELLETREHKADLVLTRGNETDVQAVLVPQPQSVE